MQTSGTAPVLNVTFREEGFNQDPFPVLEEIRRAGPLVYNEALDRWMVTSHADVSRVLGDGRHYAQGSAEAFVDFFGGPTMETIDDRERHCDACLRVALQRWRPVEDGGHAHGSQLDHSASLG